MENKKNPVETVFVESLHSPVVKLSGVADLMRLINLYECRNVYWSKETSSERQTLTAESMARSGKDMAFILIDGVAMAIQTSLFKNFNEMTKGNSKGFLNGEDYRKASDLGIDNSEEFSNFIESGFETTSEFRKIMKTKIPLVFEAWEQCYQLFQPEDELPDPRTLCSFVEENILEATGFSRSKTDTIVDAYSKGFWLEGDYSKAKKIGYESANDYFLALDFEIEDPKELDVLKCHNISDERKWLDFCDFREEIKSEGFHDAFGYLLNPIFKDAAPGSNIDFRTVRNTINLKVIGQFGIQDGPYHIFLHTLTDQECRRYLANHSDLKDLVYISGNYLKRRAFSNIEKKSAIIDISNVVLHFNDRFDDKRVADSELLFNLVDHLKSLGVEKFIGFADANIHYDLNDEEIAKIKSILNVFQIVKSGEPADIYILQYAQDNPGIIVSNDHYSDWLTERHPWRTKNVPRLLLEFTFTESKQVSFDSKEDELSSSH
jgi:hypothetical protein